LVDDQSCDALGIYIHYLFLQTLIMERFINRSEKTRQYNKLYKVVD